MSKVHAARSGKSGGVTLKHVRVSHGTKRWLQRVVPIVTVPIIVSTDTACLITGLGSTETSASASVEIKCLTCKNVSYVAAGEGVKPHVCPMQI